MSYWSDWWEVMKMLIRKIIRDFIFNLFNRKKKRG